MKTITSRSSNPTSIWSQTLSSAIVVGLLAVGSTSPAAAQFTQYTSASDFQDDFASMDQLLDEAIADARWRRGRFSLDPWLALRELSYDDNVGNRAREPIISDYLAIVGAGLRAYTPVATDLTFAAHVLPEVVFWQELDERRRVNGRYGAGLFGGAGPVDLEVSIQHIEDTKYFSREFEDRVNTTEDVGKIDLELDIGRGLAVFGGASLVSYGFEEEDVGLDPTVGVLDRDEILGRLGVRFRPRDNLTLGLGVELSDVDFDRDNRRANSGISPIVQLDFEGNRLAATARLSLRNLEAEGDNSLFPDFDELSGRLRTAWQISGPVQFEILANRNLVYSFQSNFAYFEDESWAAGPRLSLGSRAGLSLRYEEGSNRFATFEGSTAEPRLDDFDGWAGELQVELGPFTLLIKASRTEYQSNLPQFDRDVTTISSGLIFGQRNQSPWG